MRFRSRNFNKFHESPRRGETFVTRKITRGLAAILASRAERLYPGNIDARRDWGYAPDYVEAMWFILQQADPADYVIGTGETHSVREFLEEAFSYAGLDWRDRVEIDPQYFRPTEVDFLLADASKASRALGWKPRISFRDFVRIMVDADLTDAGLPCPGEGRKALAAKNLSWTRG